MAAEPGTAEWAGFRRWRIAGWPKPVPADPALAAQSRMEEGGVNSEPHAVNSGRAALARHHCGQLQRGVEPHELGGRRLAPIVRGRSACAHKLIAHSAHYRHHHTYTPPPLLQNNGRFGSAGGLRAGGSSGGNGGDDGCSGVGVSSAGAAAASCRGERPSPGVPGLTSACAGFQKDLEEFCNKRSRGGQFSFCLTYHLLTCEISNCGYRN